MVLLNYPEPTTLESLQGPILIHKDYINLTDQDYEGLPPLVPAGGDRESILNDVVQGWVEDTIALTNEHGDVSADFNKINSCAAALKWIDLRDDNVDAEPIDLGELLKEVAIQLACKRDAANLHPRRVMATLLGCKIHKCDAYSLNFPAHIWIGMCYFEGAANFGGTTFGGHAYFRDTSFKDAANFHESTFRSHANFRKTTFSAYTTFCFTSFNGEAFFSNCTFREYAKFECSSFRRNANFANATFNEYADFCQAHFNTHAYFMNTTFRDGANFFFANFCSRLSLQPAIDSVGVSMKMSRLYGTYLESCDLRLVSLADAIWRPRQPARWTDLRISLADILHWSRIRSIGRLHVLTRASYAALLLVPMIAGAWPGVQAMARRYHITLRGAADTLRDATDKALQAGVPLSQEQIGNTQETLAAIDKLIAETYYLPFSWLLVFLAALAVALGHLFYQILAPQLIQERSADDLVGDANELNRVDGIITDERLRQAIDHLRTAAEALPHRRSPWLVTRNRRTVWLPHDLDLYEPIPVSDPMPANLDEKRQIDAHVQEVSDGDRKRIAIEEGERARYEVEVFRSQPAAWLSGGLYLLGGWYLLIIIVTQFANIADAAGMGSAREFIHPYGHAAAGWGTLVFLAMMVIGRLLAWDGLWEWLAGFTKRLRRSKQDG